MNNIDFDLDAYLKRIHFEQEVDTTIDCLVGLHYSQLHTIPFENLDIHLGRPIELAPEKLVKKLVYANRGGYCFELNGLFLAALKTIGFEARALLGRVHITGTATGRGHQISLVTVENKQWIVDVGFGGDTPRAPIPLKIDTLFDLEGQSLRIIPSKEFGFMIQVHRHEAWQDLYSFDLEHVCQGDIDYGNYYTSNNPGSVFVTSRIAVLPLKEGYVTLFNNTLKTVLPDREISTEADNGMDYLQSLEKHFGICIDPSVETFEKLGV